MHAPGLPPAAELIPQALERCLRAAAPFAFATYQVGIKAGRRARGLPPAQVAAWKSELKRRLGTALGQAWSGEGRLFDPLRPEMLLVYDLDARRVERSVRSVYVYGRYRKLARGLPQTRAPWPCPDCGRTGCARCEETGLRYPVSVEDLLGRPLARAIIGRDRGYQLHGLGREDIDVRCLGDGRPFVMELKVPRRRSGELETAAAAIAAEAQGRVELPGGLRWAPEELVARLKGWEADKRYLARCRAEAPVDSAAVTALDEALSGVELAQRTPQRVARRRSDLVRRRRVRELTARALEPTHFELEVEAQSGTYIKELISGDEGRTEPSVAGLLGVPSVCVELDVLAIRVRDEELLAAPATAPPAEPR